MKKIIILLAIMFLSFQAQAHPYVKINADELLKLKKENFDLVIIDSRWGDMFDGTMIEGAKHLTMHDTTEKNLSRIAPNKNSPIVFYCTDESCTDSSRAAYKAANLGYVRLYNYEAGIWDWKKRDLPITKSTANN